MINSRRHGVLDVAAIALFGGLSACRWLASPARLALGAASAFHASYATRTDYEAGVWPRLTMRRHLALDSITGGALCIAGLVMRQPPLTRLVLLGAGLAQLGIAASSSRVAADGPGSDELPVGYPPLDTLKQVAPDLFIVDSLLPGAIGKALAVRMTVIRLAGGELLLHSPTRFSEALRLELEAIGRIRHLVAPSIGHWTFLEGWQRNVEGLRTWAAPGLRNRRAVRRSGVRLDADLGDDAPPEWGAGIELIPVRGGLGFTEIGLFHQPTRTLVLTDLVLNLEVSHLPRWLRPLAHYLGVLEPDGMPPPYVRAVIKRRSADAAAGARVLLALAPARVVFAHGRWFDQDGAIALRRSLRWLVQ